MSAVAKTIAEPQELAASIGKPFEVVLTSPGATGYEWTPEFDTRALTLVQRRRKSASSRSFGASAQEIFTFRPLSRGVVAVRFDLKRPWETAALEQRWFAVEVG